MATEELKDMLQYGHLELADKTMDPGYIQHNPNVPQGRDGFKTVHEPGSRTRTTQGDQARMEERARLDADQWPLLFDDVGPHGERSGRSQQDVHLESLRCGSHGEGKIKEHWDEARINAPAAGGKGK